MQAIKTLKKAGYKIAGIEQAFGSIPLQEFKTEPDEKVAIIFGNEVHGLSDMIISALDVCVEIPQFGTKHSLNISVSAGVVLWHLVRQLWLV